MTESLIKLHELVKEHPFRINNDKKYLRSYINTYRNFIKQFWKDFPYDKNDKQRCGLDMMVHDLYKILYKIQYNNDYSSRDLQFIEVALSAHHLYMDYGICPTTYRLWYNKDGFDTFVWFEQYQKYFIKFYDKKEYLRRIEWFRNQWKDADNKDIEEVVEEYCNEMQFIYDHYDELFGRDLQHIGKEDNG